MWVFKGKYSQIAPNLMRAFFFENPPFFFKKKKTKQKQKNDWRLVGVHCKFLNIRDKSEKVEKLSRVKCIFYWIKKGLIKYVSFLK
jgi:hypothetical protein